jgi:hypothetical protein
MAAAVRNAEVGRVIAENDRATWDCPAKEPSCATIETDVFVRWG